MQYPQSRPFLLASASLCALLHITNAPCPSHCPFPPALISQPLIVLHHDYLVWTIHRYALIHSLTVLTIASPSQSLSPCLSCPGSLATFYPWESYNQPWTSHGLHGSWVSRRRESLRIHGQPTSADVRDSHYFLGSADIGQKRRKVYTISCVLKVRRCTQCLGNKLQHFYICDFKSGHQIISLSIWDIINS